MCVILPKSLKDRKDLNLESCLSWKKLDLITKLICLSSLKSISIKPPKFFTEGFTNGFKTPRSRSGGSQAPPGVNNITSVLSSLHFKKCTAIQALISSRQHKSGAIEFECFCFNEQWNETLYFLKIVPRGGIYKENRIGPKMEPWGTQHEKHAEEDIKSPRRTEKLLPDKYDWNHSNTVPLMPTHCSIQDFKMLWSAVSNAAVISRSIRTA